MGHFYRWSATLRLDLLFFSLPYAALWSELPRSGGTLMVLMHALLMLLYGCSLALGALAARREPTVALLPGRELLDDDLAHHALMFLGVMSAVVVLGLLIAQWRLGLVALASGGLILWLGGTANRATPPRSLKPEVLWPLAMLILPALLIGAQSASGLPPSAGGEAPSARWSMPRPVWGATLLGAIMLMNFVLLTQLRDEHSDRAVGRGSLAVNPGRGMAAVCALAASFIGIALACWGASDQWWSWITPALVAYGTVLSAAAQAVGRDERAIQIWTLTHACTAAAMLFTIRM